MKPTEQESEQVDDDQADESEDDQGMEKYVGIIALIVIAIIIILIVIFLWLMKRKKESMDSHIFSPETAAQSLKLDEVELEE